MGQPCERQRLWQPCSSLACIPALCTMYPYASSAQASHYCEVSTPCTPCPTPCIHRPPRMGQYALCCCVIHTGSQSQLHVSTCHLEGPCVLCLRKRLVAIACSYEIPALHLRPHVRPHAFSSWQARSPLRLLLILFIPTCMNPSTCARTCYPGGAPSIIRPHIQRPLHGTRECQFLRSRFPTNHLSFSMILQKSSLTVGKSYSAHCIACTHARGNCSSPRACRLNCWLPTWLELNGRSGGFYQFNGMEWVEKG